MEWTRTANPTPASSSSGAREFKPQLKNKDGEDATDQQTSAEAAAAAGAEADGADAELAEASSF